VTGLSEVRKRTILKEVFGAVSRRWTTGGRAGLQRSVLLFQPSHGRFFWKGSLDFFYRVHFEMKNFSERKQSRLEFF